MARSAASYILMLDEQSSQAQNVLHTFVCLTRQRRARHKVLHKSLTMKHCFAKAPQYEASPVFISLRRGKPFHSDMKHFAYAPYDLSSIALRATDDVRKWKMRVYPLAIQRCPHYIMTCNPVLYGWIFCVLILPKEPQAFTAQFPRNREQIENAKFSLNRCVLNKVAANSLFGKVGGRL